MFTAYTLSYKIKLIF